MLRYLTAGESHGKCLTAILEGIPAGLDIDIDYINQDLARRQQGYGRGARMGIEKDKVEILSGVRAGQTIGGPITLVVKNKDFCIDTLPEVLVPRPGHADLPGILKYKRDDARDILERSSARETAVKVAVGSLIKLFLKQFGIEFASHVVAIGSIENTKSVSFKEAVKSKESQVGCACKEIELNMIKEIDNAKKNNSSLGGIIEVIIQGVPIGLGSYVQADRKLDARLAMSVMGIQAIKGVEIGKAFENAKLSGHDVHDEIYYDELRGYYHKTNNAGGIEGGMSNGENIIIRAAMKPIPTLLKPLNTINIKTLKTAQASIERSDVCATPACAVVCECTCAFEVANAFLEKFGGDSIKEVKKHYAK